MKFRNYINEIFDNPYEYKKTKDNPDGLVFKFKSEDGGKFKVHVDFDDFGDTEIHFSKDKEIEMTGEGDAFRIFATIKKIIMDNKKKIKKNSENISIIGKTKDRGRVKFYKSVAGWVKKQFKGSIPVEKIDTYDDAGKSYTNFYVDLEGS